jgi:hypothetical protein
MAKKFEVRGAFHSPGLGAWISPDSADLIAELPEDERQHQLEVGNLFEREVSDEPEAETRPVRRRRGGQS